jgi:hypothetical protein
MRAKSFFYVCAGLFLLALGYHLGARNATAQSPGGITVGGIADNGNTGVVIGRELWVMADTRYAPSPVTPYPIPGSSPVIACGANGGNGRVVLANGEEWWAYTGGPWTLVAVFPGGPTPVQQDSWGGVKARYR